MTLCGQTKLQLPHWMHVSGSHSATNSEIRRFSYVVVPLGKVPSTGRALTGRDSPRPAIIAAVTVRTNSGRVVRDDQGQGVPGPRRGRDRDLGQRRHRAVDRRLVAPHDLPAAPAVGLADRRLDPLQRLVARQHPGDGEEAGLQDGVRPPGQPGLTGDGIGVDGEQPQPAVDDLLLHRRGQGVPHLVGRLRRVEQQRRAVLGGGQDVDLVQQGEVVDADEPGLGSPATARRSVRAEAQVRHGQPAGLLRVVDEVGLGVHLRVLGEDLHGVLVRSDRPVRADAVEDRPQRRGVLDVEVGVVRQARCRRRRR